MGKAQYKTKQMSEILNLLQQMEGTHVTVADICGYFKKKGIAVGMTTVYRQLDKMVSEGLVAKYVVDGTSSVLNILVIADMNVKSKRIIVNAKNAGNSFICSAAKWKT